MSYLSTLFFFSFTLYLTLGLYILIRNPKPLLSKLCLAFIACMASWNVLSIYIQSPIISRETAELLTNIGSLFWLNTGSIFLLFMLEFSGKRDLLKKKYLYILLFTPPLLLHVVQWNELLINRYTLEAWGWRATWGDTVWPYVFFVFYPAVVLAGLFLAFRQMRSSGSTVKQKQAKILFFSALAPFAGGSLTDIILPVMGVYSVPDLAPFIIIIWASGVAYAAIKYKFLGVNAVGRDSSIRTAMLDCLVLLNRRGKITSVNEATLVLLDYREDQLLGKPLSILLEDDGENLAADLMKRENLEKRDLVFVSRTGGKIPVTFSSSLLLDAGDNVEGAVCVARDVTQIKRSETIKDVLLNISEAARRSVNLAQLLEVVQQEVGRLVEARNFYVALAYDREKCLYKFPYIMDENPDEMEEPENIVALRSSYTDYVLRTETPLLADPEKYGELLARKEIQLIGERPLCWLGVPLKTQEDNAIGVMVVQSYSNGQAYSESDVDVLSIISNSITAAIIYKQTENEKQELQERLVRSEKMEAIGRLAGGVAHDLNNVLSAIVGYPDLLLMKLPKTSPARKAIIAMQQSGQKAAAIVQDLLTLARRGLSIKESEDINHIVYEYLKSPEFEKLTFIHPGVRFSTRLAENLPPIKGSYIHLSKTLMNLVTNAAEAIPDNGEVVICSQLLRLDSTWDGFYQSIEAGDYVLLTVSDTGVGISPGDLGKIFEPFYTKKEMGKSGTGLGMAVVWGTMEDHNGFIDVSSTEGKGTCFKLYFPATTEKNSLGKTEVSIGEYLGSGQKILVVDDVEEQREIAKALLIELGYSIHVVSSGEAALQYLGGESAHLVLLDMLLGSGMDGLDVYKGILELRPGIKCIITSGFSQSERVKEALRLGAGTYIKKPYTLQTIGMAIKKELNRTT